MTKKTGTNANNYCLSGRKEHQGNTRVLITNIFAKVVIIKKLIHTGIFSTNLNLERKGQEVFTSLSTRHCRETYLGELPLVELLPLASFYQFSRIPSVSSREMRCLSGPHCGCQTVGREK